MCSRSGMCLGLASSLRNWGHLPGLRPREQRCTEVGSYVEGLHRGLPWMGRGAVEVSITPEKVGTLARENGDAGQAKAVDRQGDFCVVHSLELWSSWSFLRNTRWPVVLKEP